MSQTTPLIHPSRPCRVLLALGAAALLFASTTGVGVAEEASDELIEKVGELPILYPGGFPSPHFPDEDDTTTQVDLVLTPARRRAYELFALQQPPRLGIRSFDLDTFEPLGPGEVGTPGYGEVPGQVIRRGSALFTGPVLYALDDQRGHLFVVAENKITRIDLDALDQGKEFLLAASEASFPTTLTHYIDPTTGAPKLLAAAADGTISRLDAATLTEEWLLPRYRACPVLYPNSLWRSTQDNSLYMVCTTTPSGFRPRLVRVGLGVQPEVGDVPGDADDFSFAVGPNAHLEAAVPDPAIDRVTLVTNGPGSKGRSVWVFDGPGEALAGTATFLPEFPDDRRFSYGADPATGRVYGFAEDYVTLADPPQARRGGLYLFDTRLTPINQAVSFPELAYPPQGRILVDPAAGDRGSRVFLRQGSPKELHACYKFPHLRERDDGTEEGGCPLQHHYTVYADNVAVPRQPVPADLDVNTQGVTEAPGLTERTFEASGGAFGARARLVGGGRGTINGQFGTVATNDPLYAEDFNCNFVVGSVGGTIGGFGCASLLYEQGRWPAPVCWATDREAYAAQVKDAIVSPHEATATAASLAPDAATIEDQRAPATRCKSMLTPAKVPPPNIAGLAGQDDPPTVEDPPYTAADQRTNSEWTFPQVSCSGDKDHQDGLTTLRQVPTTTDPEDPQDPYDLALPASHPGYGASVSCRHEEDAAEGGATATPLAAGAGAEVTVGESRSAVNVARLDKGGVKVVSAAWARGIQIGDVTIEAVTAKATSVAKGRAGTATTTFTRTICGISIGGSKPSPCYTATQDPACLVAPALPSGRQIRSASPDERANPLFGAPAEALGAPGGVCEDPLETLIGQVNLHLGNAVETEGPNAGLGLTAEAVLTGRIELKLRQPDPLLAQGTPGGYIAGVQKREVQVANDALFYRDFAREIPGLEITITRGSVKYGTSRQVIQLAGVRATTSYGTLCLSPLVPQGGECKQGEDTGTEDFGSVEDAFHPDSPAPEVTLPTGSPDYNSTPPTQTPTGPGPSPAAPPAPPPGPADKARAFLVRSFSEGIMGTGIFFALGLPIYLATRRLTLRRAFPAAP